MSEEMVGFVGLGRMGQPIAQKLLQALKSQINLIAFDLQPERVVPLVALGAHMAANLTDVATPGGIVLTMLPDDEALLQVSDLLLSRLGPDGILVSLSTISPQLSIQLSQQAARRDCSFVAATVLGRPEVAARGELTLLLSGPQDVKQRVRPLLVPATNAIQDLGERMEAATLAKLGCNLMIAAAIEAMGEAATLMDAAGVDRAAFLRLLVDSALFGGAVYTGYGHLIGTRNFSEAHFPVPLGLKDVHLILDMSQQMALDLPVVVSSLDHLLAAQDAGREAEDWSVSTEFIHPLPRSFPWERNADGW